MSIRKERLRGVGDQGRQIDDVRRRRAGVLGSQAELGGEFTTDPQRRLRLRADQLGLASQSDVEALKAELETIKQAQAESESNG